MYAAGEVAAALQQRFGGGGAVRHEGEVAERPAGRRDQRLVAALLGLGERGPEIAAGVAPIAGDPVGLAAPSQRLRFEVAVASLTAQPDRLGPMLRRRDDVARPERRIPAPDIVERRGAAVRRLRPRHAAEPGAEAERREQHEPQAQPLHFSAMTTSVPLSPAARRRQ